MVGVMSEPIPQDYGLLLGEVKERIRSAQYEALRKVNRELISLYWDIGRLIVERQRDAAGGDRWSRLWLTTCKPNSLASAASPLRTSGV